MSLVASALSGSKRAPPPPVPPAQTGASAAPPPPPALKWASLLPADEVERAERVSVLLRRFSGCGVGVALGEALEEEEDGADIISGLRAAAGLEEGSLLMFVRQRRNAYS